MAQRPEIPKEIDLIFDMPGREWSPWQQLRVKRWLFEDQYPHLLFIVLTNLGPPATPDDAEDTFACYCEKRLDKVMDRYDPGKGRRFWSFFLLTLKRYCFDAGDTIRGEEKWTSPLEAESDEGETYTIELIDERWISDPEMSVIQREFWELLLTCLSSLGPDGAKLKEIFIRRHLLDDLIAEIAVGLSIKPNHVRVLSHTARQRIWECLQAKGWLR